MCNHSAVLYCESYKDIDGTVWYYRVLDYSKVERSMDQESWFEVTAENEGEMTANQLEFLSMLKIPF